MKNTCLKCNHRLFTEVLYCPYCGQSQEVIEESSAVAEPPVMEDSTPVTVPELPSSPEPATSSASDPIEAEVSSAEVSPSASKTTQEQPVVYKSKPVAHTPSTSAATSSGFGKFFFILLLVIIVLVGAIVAVVWLTPSEKDQQSSSPGTSPTVPSVVTPPPVVIPTLPSAPDPVVDPLAQQVDALLVKARAALKANQFDKAQAFAESALALSPQSLETKRFIEQIKRERQQFLKDGTSIE